MTRSVARHIAFLIPTGAGGGAQRVMATLAEEIAARGRRVDLVVGRAEGPFVERIGEKVRLVALEKSGAVGGRWAAWRADPGGFLELARPFLFPLAASDMVCRLPALTRYLKDNRPDIMMSAKVHTNLVALLARRASGTSTRLVVSERGDYGEKVQTSRRWRWRHITPLMRRLYVEADAIVSVSEDLARRLPTYTGLDPQRIQVLHNPVVSSALHRQADESVDHPWFASGEPAVVLAAGRLEQRKGFQDLIAAFAKLAERRPLRLVIFGEGKLRPSLEQQVDALGLADRVVLPGWVSNLFAYMARAALFVLPSHYEGLPGVLIQALACGCPVVATDCPTGPREILEDGRLGPLVPVGDVDAMADAIAETLATPLPKALLQARGDYFSVDRAVDRYLSLFDGLAPCDALTVEEEGLGGRVATAAEAVR
jgi:glycosyltransferase involved in cell wall biosynthesis